MGELTCNIVTKDKDKVGTKVELKESPPVKCWRLVHDGRVVRDLFESSGKTWTIHTLFAATTREECETEIKRLGMEVPKDDEAVTKEK
jgi:hypothetical protein